MQVVVGIRLAAADVADDKAALLNHCYFCKAALKNKAFFNRRSAKRLGGVRRPLVCEQEISSAVCRGVPVPLQ